MFKFMIYHVQAHDLPIFAILQKQACLAKHLVDHKLELCFGPKTKSMKNMSKTKVQAYDLPTP